MIDSRDFDRLSAYIDNQLCAPERAELESRLPREPELQATLSDLQRTVRVLHLLPVVKPPRRLTLTPAMVGARSRRESLFPALRLAAAFCAIVLAIVVAGDFATRGGLPNSAAVAPDAAAATVTAVLEVPSVQSAPATPSPEGVIENYAASEASPPEATALAGPTLAMGVALAQTTPTPDETGQRFLATEGATTRLADVTPTPEATQVALGAAPLAATATPEAASDLFASAPAAEPRPAGIGPLRVFEIVISILAILLGLGAWFTRRS